MQEIPAGSSEINFNPTSVRKIVRVLNKARTHLREEGLPIQEQLGIIASQLVVRNVRLRDSDIAEVRRRLHETHRRVIPHESVVQRANRGVDIAIDLLHAIRK